ncbi:MAG TPA: hypothetical protein VGG85_19970 [Terracidiphilus sp.]|jgi:hypothetical protein
MNFGPVEKIANAVLYEGYILYPYRPSSIKNQKRWNFGTLYPRGYAEAQNPGEAWSFHAEVLLEGSSATKLDARVRFLQLVAPDKAAGHRWEQGFARFRTAESLTIADLCDGVARGFDFSILSDDESNWAPSAFVPLPCTGLLILRAEMITEDLFRIITEFSNETSVGSPKFATREAVLPSAFTSAHLLLHVAEGAFVSALDPQPRFQAAAKTCLNRGVFPVLASEQNDRSLMFCSPIILYDYPQIAPESSGDFFDGTEMDEMLALRVMTLTDSEKDEMRSSDPHARAILERLDTLPKEHLLKMHGAVRGMEPVELQKNEQVHVAMDLWNPLEERPLLESVRIFGVELRKGDRVRIWPQKQADIMDMAMEGKFAVIEAIEQDLESNIQLAVVLDDDPGRDMGLLRQAGHRFFFSPEEIEPAGTAQ